MSAMDFHYDWFSNNIPIWKRLLKKFKGKSNLLFLEIGCFEGQATLWLVQNILTNPTSKIEVIDTFEGSMEHSKEQTKDLLSTFKNNLSPFISNHPDQSKIIIRKGFSQEIIRTLGSKPKFDFIYIDASHVAKDVLEDALLCWRLLKKDGIIIFDDYGWRNYHNPLLRPDLAIDAFLLIFQGQYKLLHKGYQVAIQKKGEGVFIPKAIKDNVTEYTFIGKNILENLYSKLEEFKSRVKTLSTDLQITQSAKDYLEKDLRKIQSSKTYKIWQLYCKICRFIKLKAEE